jgi:hypothetical protein
VLTLFYKHKKLWMYAPSENEACWIPLRVMQQADDEEWDVRQGV